MSVISVPAVRRRTLRLTAGLLVAVCVGCSAPDRDRPGASDGPRGTGTAPGAAEATPAPGLRRVAPLEPGPPAARLVVTPGRHAGSTAAEAVTVQAGVLSAYSWIVDGRARIAPPRLPLPWPPTARLPMAPAGEFLLVVSAVPAPAWVDVRVYAAANARGAPIEPPLRAGSCEPLAAPSCAVAGPGGVPAVRLDLPPGGTRLITVNAAWPVPRTQAHRAGLPAGDVAVRTTWLFRVAV